MTYNPKTAVLYNVDCPVCNFEISHYADYASKHALPIRFDDLNSGALAEVQALADSEVTALVTPPCAARVH